MSTNSMGFELIEEKLYTIADIAKLLKISTRKAYDLCHDTKAIKVIRVGRCLRVKKESFDNWFNTL